MKKAFLTIFCALSICLAAGAQTQSQPETRKVLGDGTVVVNTTKIGASVDGYMGPTPVEIYISKGKVTNIKALPNSESEGYFNRAVQVLRKFIGLTVNEGIDAKVDAVSGATYSSIALIKNVKLGLKAEADRSKK